MAFRYRSGGGWADASAVRRRSGGGWVTAANVYARKNGAWVKVWPTTVPLTASISPSNIHRVVFTASGTTGAATAVTSGGTGAALSYSWSWVSNPGGISITSPSSQSTTFTRGGMTLWSTYNGTARCTVSDGTYTAYADVPVSISRESDA